MWESNLNKLIQDLANVTCLWEKLGVTYGYIEAPWVPTPNEVVEFVLDLVSVNPGDIVFDLGCGDGRIVIGAAKRGARGVCVEVDSRLIEIAQSQAREQGVDDRITFINSDIIHVDLSLASIVYMYLTTNVINKLKNKIVNELRSGTLIVSLDYSIDWLQPLDVVELNISSKYYKIYLYIV
ncbi:MAG: methyltransferase domain-containing protein [Ignisphaera sp.]